jgi:RNA polymerase-binding transcription factor DksA
MNCAICEEPISPARLLAVPTTRICVHCKSLNDEPKLGIYSPLLARSMAENSLSDPDEMGREARQLKGEW